MANILAVGIATLDVINTTDGFPEEDDEVRAVAQDIRRGGNSANTLVVLSQLGHQCHWLGSLADDASSKLIARDLEAFGINHSGCEIHQAGTTPTSYITLNKHNGSRTIVHYRDLPEMSATTFENFAIEKIDWIHFEGRNVQQTRKMLTHLRTTGFNPIISIEIEKPRDQLEDLFGTANIYFFSRSFADGKNFSDAESLLQYYAKLIPDSLLVCTWGEKGAYALDNLELLHCPAVPVSAIDTIGAGDTFNAGFIHAQLQGKSTQQSLEFACELAAKKCTIKGLKGLL